MKFPVKKDASMVAPMNLFPTFSSLQEAEAHAIAHVPAEVKNQILSILYGYHNTLLSQMSKHPN